MWIKYNRYINDETKRWVHPTFANNSSITLEKYLHNTNETLFLCNISLDTIDEDEAFNISIVLDEDVENEKNNFITTDIDK